MYTALFLSNYGTIYIKHQQDHQKGIVNITRMLQKIVWFINNFVLNLQFCNKYVKMYNRAIFGLSKNERINGQWN